MNDYSETQETQETPEKEMHQDNTLSDTGVAAMQGKPVENLRENQGPEPPPEHQPAGAVDDAGDASRAETGAEKPEVKMHRGPEGNIKPPEGWRPGGFERR